MTSVVCLQLFYLPFFAHLFISLLFSYPMTAVYLVIILCTLFICTSSPLYTHTHQVAFWRPWICTSRYWTLVSIMQVFEETVRLARNWTLSLLILVFFPFLFLLLFLIRVYHTWLLFYSLFHLRSCVAFICIIVVIIDYYGSDSQLVQVTFGLACIRGVFSSCIYVADSRPTQFPRILGSGAWQIE